MKDKENSEPISSQAIPEKVKQIMDSAQKTLARLKELKLPKDLLFQGKFSMLGTKWNDADSSDDLGEQIQQSMTMLTTYYAIDYFSDKFKKYEFTICAGDKNGPDILFEDKSGNVVLCEIFATNDPYNNEKIFHDLKILAERSQKYKNKNVYLYIVFCSPIPLRKTKKSCKAEGIKINRFDDQCTNDQCTDISYEFAGEKGFSVRVIHVTPRELQQWAENTWGFPFGERYK